MNVVPCVGWRHWLSAVVMLSMFGLWMATAVSAEVNVKAAASLPITTQDPTSIQRAIVAAGRAGERGIVIPPGVYHIPRQAVAAGHEGTHLRLENLRNLDIQAVGVTFVFADCTQHAIIFAHCENVTFRGAKLCRETVPFSQGRIEAVSLPDNTVDVRIDRGYPCEVADRTRFPYIWMNVIDPATKRWQTHLRSTSPVVIKQLAPDLFRVHTEPIRQAAVPIRPGLRVAWRGMVCNDLCVTRCHNMKIVDVTIEKGCGMCFHETGGEGGNIFENCRITAGPPPAGASEEPLLASNADGFHSGDARKGPTLARCSFELLDDDAIAIHGTYAMVLSASEKHIIVERVPSSGDPLFARPGDTLRFYDPHMVLAGKAKVLQAQRLANYQPAFLPDNNYAVFRNRAVAQYVELTLDAALPAGPCWLVANQDELGSGYTIRDCHIRNTYARGIIAKASDGLIEGCTIEGTARAAIEFNTETGIWSEADYACNVLVRNNTLRHVSLNRKTGFLRHPGAIAIFAYKDHGYVACPGGHRNITLENNRFEDNDGVNILVCSADQVTIRRNQFLRPMGQPDAFGRDKGIDPGALVWLDQCSAVHLEDNVVSSPGPHLQKLVHATETASGTGFETGVQRASP